MKKDAHPQISYVHVESSPALTAFIEDQMSGLLERVAAHDRKYSISMIIKADAKNKDAKITSFEVDGTMTVSHHANLRAVEKMSDVNKAVAAVVKSLEKQIRRLTEKQEHSRKTIDKTHTSVADFKAEAFSQNDDIK